MPYFDLTTLNEMAAGDKEFVETIVQMSLEDIPVALSKIEEALAIDDWDGVYQPAHKIKPTLQTLGIRADVWDNLLIINDSCKHKKQLEELPKRVEIFVKDVRNMIEELKNENL